MRIRLTLLFATCAAALALCAAPALASTYSITISSSTTSGGNWSNGTFTPTANANIDVSDLVAQLAANNVTIGSPSSTSTIAIQTSIASPSVNSLTFDPASAISTSSSTVSTDGSQIYDAPVTLAADVTLQAPSVTFGSTVDGGYGLTIAGNATFDQLAGSLTPLASLTVTGGTASFATTSLAEGATTSGAQSYSSSVSVDGTAGASFITSGGPVTFEGALQAQAGAGVTVHTGGGMISFDGAVGGGGEDPGYLTADGPATIDTGSIEATDAQAYMDAVTLAHDTTLTSTAVNGEVEFYGPVDGAHALSVSDDGITQVGGAVGGGVALQSLTVRGPGTTQLDGGSVKTVGAQDYQGPVALGSTSSLASSGGGNLTFESTIDGAAALTVGTAGTIAFGAPVGAGNPLTSLTVSDAAAVTIGGSPAAVDTTGAQAYGSGALTIGAAATLSSTSGQITSSGRVVYANDLTVEGSGTLSGPGSGTGSLDKQGPGTLTLAGGGTAPDAVFLQDGTLDVTGSVPGPLTEYSATTANVSGTVDGQVTVPSSAALHCTGGTINGNVVGTGTTSGAPTAPTAVTAAAATTPFAESVTFAPGTASCNPVRYTVTPDPAAGSATGSASPVTVTSLSDWTPYTFTVTATNPIGSAMSAASAPFTLRSGPPTALISAPAGGGTYRVGQQVATDFTCADATGATGIASCVDSGGASAHSGRLNTSQTGSFTYTVTATSNDGLIGTASITYTVAASPSKPPPSTGAGPPGSGRFTAWGEQARAGGAVGLTLRLPGPGRIVVTETAGRGTIGRLAARGRRGVVHLTVRLSARERRRLARRTRVTVRLVVTFIPAGGRPRTVHLRPVTLKLA